MVNTLGIGKVYLKHFVSNIDKRWVMLQGSRRSGKSFAVHKWLHFLASGKPIVTGIVCATYPALQNCISDFQRATGLVVSGSTLMGYSCKLSNGSVFLFKAYDTAEKAQGTTFTNLYLEEMLNIDEDIVSTLAMSVEKQCYCAFNPTKSGFHEKYLLPDKSNLLKTTFKQNPYLTPEQIGEFEALKERAMKPNASLLTRWQYKVYYLGEFSEMSGKVFKEVFNCTDKDFDEVKAPILYGLDFGWVNGEQTDSTALVATKIKGDSIYFKQLLYSNQLANNKDLAMAMVGCGLDCYSPIVGDYSGMGSAKIRALVTAGDYTWKEPEIRNGFTVSNCAKGKTFLDGLNKLNQYKIYVTDSSYDMRREFDDYTLKDGKRPTGLSDHAVDAGIYACNSYGLYFDLE